MRAKLIIFFFASATACRFSPSLADNDQYFSKITKS